MGLASRRPSITSYVTCRMLFTRHFPLNWVQSQNQPTLHTHSPADPAFCRRWGKGENPSTCILCPSIAVQVPVRSNWPKPEHFGKSGSGSHVWDWRRKRAGRAVTAGSGAGGPQYPSDLRPESARSFLGWTRRARSPSLRHCVAARLGSSSSPLPRHDSASSPGGAVHTAPRPAMERSGVQSGGPNGGAVPPCRSGAHTHKKVPLPVVTHRSAVWTGNGTFFLVAGRGAPIRTS